MACNRVEMNLWTYLVLTGEKHQDVPVCSWVAFVYLGACVDRCGQVIRNRVCRVHHLHWVHATWEIVEGEILEGEILERRERLEG